METFDSSVQLLWHFANTKLSIHFLKYQIRLLWNDYYNFYVIKKRKLKNIQRRNHEKFVFIKRKI